MTTFTFILHLWKWMNPSNSNRFALWGSAAWNKHRPGRKKKNRLIDWQKRNSIPRRLYKEYIISMVRVLWPYSCKVFLFINPSIFAVLLLKKRVVFALSHFLALVHFVSLACWIVQTQVCLAPTSVGRSLHTCPTEADYPCKSAPVHLKRTKQLWCDWWKGPEFPSTLFGAAVKAHQNTRASWMRDLKFISRQKMWTNAANWSVHCCCTPVWKKGSDMLRGSLSFCGHSANWPWTLTSHPSPWGANKALSDIWN